MKEARSDYNVPIYVTSVGRRYVKVDDLVRSERVQKTLRKMADIWEKQKQPPSTEKVQVE